MTEYIGEQTIKRIQQGKYKRQPEEGKKLKNPDEQVVFDSAISGYGVKRQRDDGKISFFFRWYAVKGNPYASGRTPMRYKTIGKYGPMSVTTARRVAREWQAGLDKGIEPTDEKDLLKKSGTVQEAVDNFIAFMKANPRRYKPETVRAYTRYLTKGERKDRKVDYLSATYGNRKLQSLTADDINTLFERVAAKYPYAANRLYDALSAFFTWCIQQDLYVGKNPCQRDRGRDRSIEHPADRYLNEDEMERLRSSLDRLCIRNPTVGTAIKLIMLTGCRKNEILSLHWQKNVRLHLNQLRLVDTKTGESMRIISDEAVKLLRDWGALTGMRGYVFESDRKANYPLVDVDRTWRKLLADADLSGLRLHDLRHNYASVLANSGYDLPVIGALLGHRDVKTTSRYAHLKPGTLLEAANKAGNTLK